MDSPPIAKPHQIKNWLIEGRSPARRINFDFDTFMNEYMASSRQWILSNFHSHELVASQATIHNVDIKPQATLDLNTLNPNLNPIGQYSNISDLHLPSTYSRDFQNMPDCITMDTSPYVLKTPTVLTESYFQQKSFPNSNPLSEEEEDDFGQCYGNDLRSETELNSKPLSKREEDQRFDSLEMITMITEFNNQLIDNITKIVDILVNAGSRSDSGCDQEAKSDLRDAALRYASPTTLTTYAQTDLPTKPINDVIDNNTVDVLANDASRPASGCVHKEKSHLCDAALLYVSPITVTTTCTQTDLPTKPITEYNNDVIDNETVDKLANDCSRPASGCVHKAKSLLSETGIPLAMTVSFGTQTTTPNTGLLKNDVVFPNSKPASASGRFYDGKSTKSLLKDVEILHASPIKVPLGTQIDLDQVQGTPQYGKEADVKNIIEPETAGKRITKSISGSVAFPGAPKCQ